MNSSGGNVTTFSNSEGSSRKSLQIAEYVIIILGFSANSFICFAFTYYRRIRTVNNYFVLNLAVSDMMLMLLLCIWKALPAIFKTLTEKQSSRLHLFVIIFEVFCVTASNVSITVLSFDRFLSVTKPLHYTTYITGRKAILAIGYIWIHSMVIALLGLTSELPSRKVFKYGYVPLIVLCNILLPLAITLYSYIKIFLIASRHLRYNPHQTQDANSLANITKNIKIGLHVLVLVAPLSLFWTVYYTITVVEVYCAHCISLKRHSEENWIISNMGSILGAVDPIIYIFLTKDFRKILFSWFGRGNRQPFASETFHLSTTTRATTCQASPVSCTERGFPEM